jgi:hypothetical protein
MIGKRHEYGCPYTKGTPMPKPRKELPPGQAAKIVKEYGKLDDTGRTIGLVCLSEKYGHCQTVIRRILIAGGVEMLSRGRPART